MTANPTACPQVVADIAPSECSDSAPESRVNLGQHSRTVVVVVQGWLG
jgi:hypothetical protein